MKKFLYIVIYCILGILVACDDFLETEPQQDISINQQLSTKQGVLDALNGAYSQWSNTFFTIKHAIYGDMMVGNFAFTPETIGTNAGLVTVPMDYQKTYDFLETRYESEYKDIYQNAYRIINNINLILSKVDNLTDATAQEINQIKAECLAMRAHTHFVLAKYYAQHYAFTADASHPGLVYVDTPQQVGEDFPPRLSCADTFTKITQDLQSALNLFTNNQALPGQAKAYFNTHATVAIYADVALWMNDWQTAYNMANDVIGLSGINLSVTDYANQWMGNQVLDETILYIETSVDESGVVAKDMQDFFGFINSTIYSDYTASGDLIDLYETTDLRLTNLLNIQPLEVLEFGIPNNTNFYFTQKYNQPKGMILYRLTEMYLIRAEADFRMNGTTNQTLNDVNQIRTRANASILNNISLNDIVLERRREFAFENKSFYDYARTEQNISRNQNCIAANCNLSYPNFRYILPIPQETIDLNNNIIQNEGY